MKDIDRPDRTLQEELRGLAESHRDTLWTRLRSLREAPMADGDAVKDDEERGLDEHALDIDIALVEMDAAALEAAAESLARLAQGGYGLCAECGAAIPTARLRAMPFAVRCLRCQEAAEQAGRAPLRRKPAGPLAEAEAPAA